MVAQRAEDHQDEWDAEEEQEPRHRGPALIAVQAAAVSDQGGWSGAVWSPGTLTRAAIGSRATHSATAASWSGCCSRPSITRVGTVSGGRAALAASSTARDAGNGTEREHAREVRRVRDGEGEPRPQAVPGDHGPQAPAPARGQVGQEAAQIVDYRRAEAPAAPALAARLVGNDFHPGGQGFEKGHEGRIVEGGAEIEVEDDANRGILVGPEAARAQAGIVSQPDVLDE